MRRSGADGGSASRLVSTVVLDPQFSLRPDDARHLHYGDDASSSDVDDEVAALIDHVVRVVDEARRSTVLSPGARMMCLSYCYRQCVFAVRRRSSYCLSRAVLAVVVGGMSAGDRHATSYLPVIEDAARRIGRDPTDLVDAAAWSLGEAALATTRTWFGDPDRPTMAMARWRATGAGARFDYEVVPEPAP